MPSFKDLAGREWLITVNVFTLKHLKDALGVDLMRLADGEPPLAVRLATEPVLVCEILYAILKPQMDAAGLTEEQFCQQMGGDQTARAYETFCEGLNDFFQSLGRKELAQVIRQGNRAVKATTEAVDQRIQAFDLDALI